MIRDDKLNEPTWCLEVTPHRRGDKEFDVHLRVPASHKSSFDELARRSSITSLEPYRTLTNLGASGRCY